MMKHKSAFFHHSSRPGVAFVVAAPHCAQPQLVETASQYAPRRNITIANVEAGDKIVVYMASSNAVTGELVFTYLGEDGTQKDTESFTNVGTKYEFIAQYSGSYKIYTTAAAGKPIYNRVMRIPAVTVSGTIELNGEDISGCL